MIIHVFSIPENIYPPLVGSRTSRAKITGARLPVYHQYLAQGTGSVVCRRGHLQGEGTNYNNSLLSRI